MSAAKFDGALVEAIRGIVREEVAKVLADARAEQNADHGPEDRVSVADAAKRLSMSESFIRGAIRDGRLPAERVGRSIRIRTSDLEGLTTRRRQVEGAAEFAKRRAAEILKSAGGGR